MSKRHPTAFTIIELLVVVAIISILIGILLPAVGKARDKARTSTSESNLRNLAIAHLSYAADWEDRQLTLARDQLAGYGIGVDAYHSGIGWDGGDHHEAHPPVMAGWGVDPVDGTPGLFSYWPGLPQHHWAVEPINFPEGPSCCDGFGWFRLPNCKNLSQYVNAQWYDKTYYAPKDPFWVIVERCLDDPHEFATTAACNPPVWSSYCLSPAAFFDPQVFSWNKQNESWWTDPWTLPGGFRAPSMSQIEFPSLKTQMLEHAWLQNVRTICNPSFTGTFQDACEPYYFNMGWESAPATSFYDGSVRLMGVQEALDADRRFRSQNGNEIGLWNNESTFGGEYTPSGSGGYYSDYAYDWTSTSYHILTTEGGRGRDTLGKQ